MVSTALLFAIVCVDYAAPEKANEAVSKIRVAYEANRSASATFGTMFFHSSDGVLKPSPSLAAFDADLKTRWERRSPSAGLHVFDGPYRRCDNLYPLEELIARRTKISDASWSSPISGVRLLTDGETTLVDRVDASSDAESLTHSASLKSGVAEFFRNGVGIPLSLGSPEPPDHDLGRCLEKLQAGRNGASLVALDEKASLDGRAVSRLEADFPEGPFPRRITFWIDMDRGAIPLQTRVVATDVQSGGIAMLQVNYDDLKYIGASWLPFCTILAEGDLSTGGGVQTISTQEILIESADFTLRPSQRLFSLTFPEDQALSDPNRSLGLGARRVWDVKDFSPDARAEATRRRALADHSESILPTDLSSSDWIVLIVSIFGVLLLIRVVAITLWTRYRASSPV